MRLKLRKIKQTKFTKASKTLFLSKIFFPFQSLFKDIRFFFKTKQIAVFYNLNKLIEPNNE